MEIGHLEMHPTDPRIRYAVSTTNSRHVMVVSRPSSHDDDLEAIASTCPWSMRAAGLNQAMAAIVRASHMMCDRIGEITFDSIDFVGHGQAGGLAMGRYNSRISNRIWLHPAVLAAFTDLRVRLRDERSVIRLLGCNVARPIGREHRLVGTDGELLCMALARMADHTVEACAAGVRAGDFTADGVRASLELARFDRDGQLLARSLG